MVTLLFKWWFYFPRSVSHNVITGSVFLFNVILLNVNFPLLMTWI